MTLQSQCFDEVYYDQYYYGYHWNDALVFGELGQGIHRRLDLNETEHNAIELTETENNRLETESGVHRTLILTPSEHHRLELEK